MAEKDLDQGKRRFLLTATTVGCGVAAGAAAVPFVASMLPSERAKAAGAPVEGWPNSIWMIDRPSAARRCAVRLMAMAWKGSIAAVMPLP